MGHTYELTDREVELLSIALFKEIDSHHGKGNNDRANEYREVKEKLLSD